MPKMKSHSGTKDRMRITKKGKVMTRKSGRNHFLHGKTSSRKRTYEGFQEVSSADVKNIKKNLGKA